VKIRLIKEIPQKDASSPVPVPPASPVVDPASLLKRTKRSWDEELAKFSIIDSPTTEKDSDDN
jgi:hypothetical protein